MKSPCFFGILAIATTASSSAAVIYTQDFDTFDDVPTSSVYYDAGAVYDGITGGLTGANLTGNGSLNGKLVTEQGPTVAQSGTYFMFTNTAGTTPQAEVWGTNSSQVITVEVGQIYEFSFYIAGANTIAPGILSPRVNGVALEGVTVDGFVNPGTATYAAANAWVQHTYRWQANATTADLSLFNLRATPNGNDFSLDTITFATVPEPGSSLLAGIALAGMLVRRRR